MKEGYKDEFCWNIYLKKHIRTVKSTYSINGADYLAMTSEVMDSMHDYIYPMWMVKTDLFGEGMQWDTAIPFMDIVDSDPHNFHSSGFPR